MAAWSGILRQAQDERTPAVDRHATDKRAHNDRLAQDARTPAADRHIAIVPIPAGLFLYRPRRSDIRISPMASSFSALLNWRPHTPFYYGWLVLGLSGAGAFVATAIAGVVLGGVQPYILDDTGWSRTSIGLAAGCGVWLSGLFAPFAGRLADRYGPRLLMPAGLILLGVCLIAVGGVHAAWLFFIIMVIGRSISQPLLIGVVPRTMAVNFFNRRRNIALAFTGMYRPISGALIIQAFSVIAVLADWRTAFRYLGFFSLVLAIPMILIMRRRPEDIGLLPDGATPGRVGHGAGAGRRDNHPGGAGGSSRDRRGQLHCQRGLADQGFLARGGRRIPERCRLLRPGLHPCAPPSRFRRSHYPAGRRRVERQHFPGAQQPGVGTDGEHV